MRQQKRILPPGPPIVPALLLFRSDPLAYLPRLQQTYGSLFSLYKGSPPVIFVCRPEHIQKVLKYASVFTNRQVTANLQEIVGDGLLTLDAQQHTQQRKLCAPTFKKRHVEGQFAPLISQYALELSQSLHVGATVDVASLMHKVTLRIVAKCLFDVDLNTQLDALRASFSSIVENPRSILEGILGLGINVPWTAYGKRMKAIDQVDRYLHQLIEQRKTHEEESQDILSHLVREQKRGEASLTDTQIRDHIMTFAFAGQETSANTLTWTLYLLSEHPDERSKLLEEIRSVLTSRAPTTEDIAKMPYLDWVLNESMRLYPAAWIGARQATEVFELDGYTFPAGTTIMFSQWVTHQLPEIWDDPKSFKPERWDPSSNQKKLPYTFFPFGGGPHLCIGMPFAVLEMKLLLASLLQRYTFRLCPGYHMTIEPLVSLRPKGGLPMLIEPARSVGQPK